MEVTKPSRTSDIPAIARAVHQTRDDEPKILADPIAPRLVDMKRIDAWLDAMLSHPFAPQWRAGFLLRSRYAEDCLAEGVVRGLTQYLILGTGLDTFSYRQPDWAKAIAIFEIDHPATQEDKRERLRNSGIAPPGNLTFVPVDFEMTSLANALRATSFQFDRRTFCSWPAEFASRLRGMGFSEVVPLAPQQANDRYLKERHYGLSIRHGEQMMRAIV